MKTLIFLACLMFLSACSSERQAARAIRHAQKDLRRAAILGFPEKIDTVYITKIIPADTVTVQVPGISKIRDTTVTITKDRVVIKWAVRHDTLRITAECKSDTIKTPVYITRTINAPEKESFLSELKGILWWVIILALVVIGGYVIYRKV